MAWTECNVKAPDPFYQDGYFYIEVYEKDTDETYPTNTWCNNHTPVKTCVATYAQIATTNASGAWGGDPADNYTARITQYIFCTKTTTISTSVKTDDTGTTYLNGTQLAQTNVSEASITLNLQAGLNKLEIVYTEGTGGDYGYLTNNLSYPGISHACSNNPDNGTGLTLFEDVNPTLKTTNSFKLLVKYSSSTSASSTCVRGYSKAKVKPSESSGYSIEFLSNTGSSVSSVTLTGTNWTEIEIPKDAYIMKAQYSGTKSDTAVRTIYYALFG